MKVTKNATQNRRRANVPWTTGGRPLCQSQRSEKVSRALCLFSLLKLFVGIRDFVV